MNSTRQQRRGAQILEAARQVFADRGYHEATVSDVARSAGVSEKTVYDYFQSKEELLFAIPRGPTLEVVESLERHLPYVRGAGNRIRSIIYHFLSFYVEHGEYAKVILLTLRGNSSYVKTETFEELRRVYRVIDAVVDEGIASGEFAADTDRDLVRWVVMGTVEYILLRWLLLGGPDDPVAYVDPLADMILRGIAGGPAVDGWTLRLSVERGTADGGGVVLETGGATRRVKRSTRSAGGTRRSSDSTRGR